MEDRLKSAVSSVGRPVPTVPTARRRAEEDGSWIWSEGAFDLVAPHCDIVDRLKKIPPSARVRGVWFRIIDKALSERGLIDEYDALLPDRRFRALPMYPVSEFLVHSAVAGALIAGPSRLHEGMFQMAHDNAKEFAESLFGRTLIRLLARDPKRLTQQAVASSRQTTNYGRRVAVFPDDGTVEVHYRDEYVWIESYMAGAAAGTYESLGYRVSVETDLTSPFDGVLRSCLEPSKGSGRLSDRGATSSTRRRGDG